MLFPSPNLIALIVHRNNLFYPGYTSHFVPSYAFSGSNWSPSQIVLAIYQGEWAYAGYTVLNYGIEDLEIKDFRKYGIYWTQMIVMLEPFPGQ